MNVIKVVLLAFLLAIPGVSGAVDVWKSSFTTTQDSMQVLCGGGRRGLFHGLCTGTNVGSSSMSVVNSSYTLTGVQKLAQYATTSNGPCNYYDVAAPKGLLYDKFSTGWAVILYQCY